MKNKKGFTIVELLSVIVLLGIIVSIGVLSVSSIRGSILNKQYKNIKTEIELAAEKYYEDTDSEAVYVETLITEGYLKADNKSMTITNPKDNTSLNCYLAKIDDDGNASLVEENKADENGKCIDADIINGKITIVNNADSEKIETNRWYKESLTLKAKLLNEDNSNKYKYTWKSEKNPNVIKSSDTENTFDLSEIYELNGKVINDIFYVTAINKSDNTDVLKSSGTRVKIDGVAPEFISVNVEAENEWRTQKVVTIDAEDQGSGIDGYIVSEDDCINKDFGEYTKIEVINPNKVKIKYTVKKNGTYSICLKDKAGNVKKYDEDVIITKIDTTPPKCEYSENYNWRSSNVDIKYGCKEEHPNDTNQSGCSKVIKNNTTSCVNKETCYYERAQTFIKTTDMANIKGSIGTFTIEDIAGNKVECPVAPKTEVSVKLDKTKPEISSVEVRSNDSRYNSIYTTVTVKALDKHSGLKAVCVINENNIKNCENNWVSVDNCTKQGNTYTCSIKLTINSWDGSGANKTVYAFTKDNVDNIQTKTASYKVYAVCTETVFKSYGSCSSVCGGGQLYEYRNDKYLNTSCDGYYGSPCNTQDCCSSTYLSYSRETGCSTSCGSGTTTIYYDKISNYDGSYCGTQTSYGSCYDDSGCYYPEPDPDPTPNPNPGGGGGGSSNCDTINGNRCDRSADILYWISDCCDGVCNYAAKAGSTAYGTISRSRLSAASNCSSYGPGTGGGGSSGGGSSGGTCRCTSDSQCGSNMYCSNQYCCRKNSLSNGRADCCA